MSHDLFKIVLFFLLVLTLGYVFQDKMVYLIINNNTLQQLQQAKINLFYHIKKEGKFNCCLFTFFYYENSENKQKKKTYRESV